MRPDQRRYAFFRDLAFTMRGVRDFRSHIENDHAAARIFQAHTHGKDCPRCGKKGRLSLTADLDHLRCDACFAYQCPLTRGTPLAGTRLPLRLWLAAIWHVLVDTETTSGSAFARKHDLARRQTGWWLLREVRKAIPHPSACEPGATAQVLGRVSPANTAFVTLSKHGGAITAVLAEDACPAPGRPLPIASLLLGRLRAWIADVYRGVTRRYLDLYLAELVSRFHRVQSLPPPQPHLQALA